MDNNAPGVGYYVVTSPVFATKTEYVTGLVVTEQNGVPVAVVGTQQGNLHQVCYTFV